MIGDIIDNKYYIKEKIGEGSISEVYLGEYQGESYAIKVLKNEVFSNRLSDIIRFKNEARIISKINHKNIAKFYAIGEWKGYHYLVREYVNGESLYHAIKSNRNFTIDEITNIMIQVCEGLKFAHEKGIIHRDLKPGNILLGYKSTVNDQSYDVKLIDFGVALLKEMDKIQQEEEIVGTFGYISPEQCGILKRPVDERSDLYSLGIILYQLLTGKLPFEGNNISSLIHQHIAKLPIPPHYIRYSIPEILEKITLKLIEKEPENRYQSVNGLLNDLKKFNSGEKNFVLGLDDNIMKLSFKTKLIGKDKEFFILKNLFNNTLKGYGSFCVIKGGAGSGKTIFMENFNEFVFEKGGTILQGDCLPQNILSPYTLIRSILDNFVLLLDKLQNNKENLLSKVKEELGELVLVLKLINPKLSQYFEETYKTSELDSEIIYRRYISALTKLFIVLANFFRPLIIEINNIQWADNESMEVLLELIRNINLHPILIIGKYLDEELNVNYIFKNYLKFIKENYHHVYSEIQLKPLDRESVKELIKNILIKEFEDIEFLTNFIYEKSYGNPMLIIEIIRQLTNENVLYYHQSKWRLDKEKLKYLKLPSSIIEIISKRILSLNNDELHLLSIASIINKEFDIELLTNLTNIDRAKIISIIDKSIKEQFLEENKNNKTFYFIHEKIKRIFQENTSSSERLEINHKIAQYLEKKAKEKGNLEEHIFDIIHYYLESDDKEKILEYLIPAAELAKSTYANDSAIFYYRKALELINNKNMKGSPQWKKCMEELIELNLRIGNSNNAIELTNKLLFYINDKIEEARIYKQICQAYYKKSDWKNCEAYGKDGLKLLGEKLPQNSSQIFFRIIKESIFQMFYEIFSFYYFKRKKKINEKDELILSFYLILNWMYAYTDTLKFMANQLIMINLAISKAGYSRELAIGLSAHASYLMSVGKFKKSRFYHEKSLEILKDLKDEWGIAHCYHLLGFYYQWNGLYKKSISYFSQAIEIFRKLGDIRELASCLNGLTVSYNYLSDYINSRSTNEQYYEVLNKLKDNMALIFYYNNKLNISVNKGELEESETIAQKAYQISKTNNDWFSYTIILIQLGKISLLKGEYNKSINYLEEAKILFKKNYFIKQYIGHLFYLLAMAHFEELKIEFVRLSKHEINIKEKLIKNYLKESLKLSKKWITHYSMSLLSNAKFYFYKNKIKKSINFYLKAIEYSGKLENKMDNAICLYEYGTMLYKIGNVDKAKEYFEKAYNIFENLDAKYYIHKIMEVYGDKRKLEDEKESPTSYQKLMDKQRLYSIIRLSQDISSILSLQELLDKIISVAIEITGATRGFLFIKNEKTNELELKAKRNIEENKILFTTDEFSSNIINQVFQTKEPILTYNAADDENLRKFQSVINFNIKSLLCVPILYKNTIKGVCYVDNPLSSGVFNEEDKDVLNVLMAQAAISIENARIFSNFLQIVNSLIAHSSSRIYEFTEKVMKYSTLLARKMNLNNDDIENIRIAALLHDIGLIGHADLFFHSGKSLSDYEQKILSSHPKKSIDIIKYLDGMDKIIQIISQHHERYNGSGYPHHLKGEEINIGAQIIGLIDDFVLMLAKREYQILNKKQKIINDLRKNKGILYEPTLLDKFVELIEEENLIYIIRESDIIEYQRDNEIIWEMPSNTNFESIIVGKVMDVISKKVNLPAELAFSIDYSLAEVIRNAIVHGNKYDESKKVKISLIIDKLQDNKNKIILKVSDQGEGMDIREHNRFSKIRKNLFSIINELKDYRIKNKLSNEDNFSQIIYKLEEFKDTFYTDYNTFRQLEGTEITGGVGLLYIQKIFDNIEFKNIVDEGKIIGFEVLMEKII